MNEKSDDMGAYINSMNGNFTEVIIHKWDKKVAIVSDAMLCR